jgi:hypothetical protein
MWTRKPAPEREPEQASTIAAVAAGGKVVVIAEQRHVEAAGSEPAHQCERASAFKKGRRVYIVCDQNHVIKTMSLRDYAYDSMGLPHPSQLEPLTLPPADQSAGDFEQDNLLDLIP